MTGKTTARAVITGSKTALLGESALKHLFIVNPAAGGRDKTEYVRSLAAPLMARLGQEYEVYTTLAPMDACDKIRTEANGGELRVYACGGDGTLNECVNGAYGLTGVSVTHFPCGTGNDFIKSFQGNEERFSDLEALVLGETHRLDLVSVNGRMSINICSVGFDARVGGDVHKYSALPLVGGKGGYILSLIVNLIKGICGRLRINSGDYTFLGDISLVCACNGSWYGGSFNPMPDAVLDDGFIDFLIVHKLSRLKFLQLVGKYAAGRYRELGEVITYVRGHRLDLEAEQPIPVNVDGEIITARKLNFEVVPRGLSFILPAGMGYGTDAPAKSGDISSNMEISAN